MPERDTKHCTTEKCLLWQSLKKLAFDRFLENSAAELLTLLRLATKI